MSILRSVLTGVAILAGALTGVLALEVSTAAAQQPSTPLSTDGDIPLHLGRMYGQTSSKRAWEALEQTLTRLAFKTERRKPNDGVAVTKWRTGGPTRFQFHVFVPQRIEPARVYVGSISTRDELTTFDDAGGNNAFYTEFERDLGTSGESIPQEPLRRTVKSMTLARPDGNIDCHRKLISGQIGTSFTQPEEISAAPSLNLRPGRSAVIRVEGHMGEDGYFRPMRVVEGDAANQDLIFLTFGAASLTRYRPGIADGCGVPLTMTFSMTRWR